MSEICESITRNLIELTPVLYRTFFQGTVAGESLAPLQLRALVILENKGMLHMTDLAEQLMIPRQQLTKIVEALVEKKLVCRLENAKNKRLIMVGLTQAGSTILKSHFDLNATFLENPISRLSDRDQRDLMNGIEILKRVLSNAK